MKRITKLSALSAVAMLAVVAVATAAVKTGDYNGITQNDEEPITIEVAKKPGKSGKYVTDIFVEQSDECTEDLHFTKDAKIQGGEFTAKIRLENLNATLATVKGEFVTEGVIAGKLKQVTCDGNDDPYTAYLES